MKVKGSRSRSQQSTRSKQAGSCLQLKGILVAIIIINIIKNNSITPTTITIITVIVITARKCGLVKVLPLFVCVCVCIRVITFEPPDSWICK